MSVLTEYSEKYNDIWFGAKEGKIIISPSTAKRATSVSIDRSEVFITNQRGIAGVSVDDAGVTLQGVANFTSWGDSIIKGNFTENPRGSKPYTYTETVYFESAAKEILYEKLYETTGVDASVIDAGLMPIVTDIAPGNMPHVHTISMKHTHRVEPSYLYRLPGILRMFKGFRGAWRDFLRFGSEFTAGTPRG